MNLQNAIETLKRLHPVFAKTGVQGNPVITDDEVRQLRSACRYCAGVPHGLNQLLPELQSYVWNAAVVALHSEAESIDRMLDARKHH